MIIGPSTGWLYSKRDIYSLSEQEQIIRKSGANAIELMIVPWDERRVQSLIGDENFGRFEYTSLHLPNYDGSKIVISPELIRLIIEKHGVKNTFIHMNNVPPSYFEQMAMENIPFAVENVDKTIGCKLKTLEALLETFDLGVVLDVQHAYEHDQSMVYAQELFDLVKERIIHLHVSGENSKINHSLVHQSDNIEEIVAFVSKILSKKKVPLILEGQYTEPEEVKVEIEFLRKEFN